MPRFTDQWVIDRVLYDYISGGSCSCCGFQHFLPSGTAGLIAAVSDLESDQAAHEVQALVHHPWPAPLRDQVWADRVKLRQRLKREIPQYAQFWQQHGQGFTSWCLEQQQQEEEEEGKGSRWLQRITQCPRQEIMDRLQGAPYQIHSAYGVVLCTVLEQVAHFASTGYGLDAPAGDASELQFEQYVLKYDPRGGFVMNAAVSAIDDEGRANHPSSKSSTPGTEKLSLTTEMILNMWQTRMKSLGGPTLLARGQKSREEKDDEPDEKGGDDDDEEDGPADDPMGPVRNKVSAYKAPVVPSFSSDRRLLRLVIARYWADLLQAKYLKSLTSTSSSNNGES